MLFIDNLSNMGSAFRQERKALGMTQVEVAGKAGVRRESIIRLEAGENIDAITLLKAVGALGKALTIADRRISYDNLRELFRDE